MFYINYNCDYCNKEFQITPSRLKNKNICCSKECAALLKKSFGINCECVICKKPLHRRPYELKRNKNTTCSVECLSKLKVEIYKGEGNHQYGLIGDLNSSYKTGKKISPYGYVLVLNSTHPFNYNGYYPEHRIIAEENLLLDENDIIIINNKKYLKPERVIHHIDFNKKNNNPENLFIFKNVSMHTLYHNLYKKHKYSLDEFFEYYNTYLYNLYENKEWLYDIYINQKYSIKKISEITKSKWDTVKQILVSKNIIQKENKYTYENNN